MIRGRIICGVAAALFFSLVEPLNAWAAQQSSSKIDRVELNGVTAFSQTEVESTLEIGPGDYVDRGKILRTVENLTNLYHSHGYQSVRVSERQEEKHENGKAILLLEYDVLEGKPTGVADVRLKLLHEEDPVLQKYWSSIEPKLRAKIALKAGDFMDQEKIANARHALQESLNSEEFIGARVDDVRFVPNTQYAEAAKKSTVEKWETIEFDIDLGDRVTFGFRGLHAVPASTLQALIDEQRVIGLGKDYVDAIRVRIEDEYRSMGYAQVKVQVFPFERPEQHERHITYVIDEGPRILVENIQFDGNSIFSSADLKQEFLKRASAVVAHGYYVEKDVQKGAELLVEYMKSRGYLSAKLVTINHAFLLKPRKIDSGKSVDITIFVYEGEQTIVRKAEFLGNQAISTQEIQKLLGLYENQPLNLFSLTDGMEALKAAYRNKGYLSVRIANENTESVVTYSEENRFAEVSLEIVEGSRFKVGTVSIEGLSQTKEFVVRREILFHEGQVLEESQVTGTEARLHRLGIFSVITIRALDDPERSDIKDVKISLQEGTPGVVGGGVGLRNDLGPRVFSQVGYQNLWGDNHTLILNSAANHRIQNYHFTEYEAQLAYIWPWFMWGETTLRPTATVSGTEYVDFDAVTAQFALSWERKLATHPNLTGIFTYSLERVIQFNATTASDNQALRIGSIIPQLRLDMRDSPLNPTSGFFGTASYEIASPWLLSQHDPYPLGYTIAMLRGDYYIPVTQDLVWYLSFRTGYERSLEQQQYDSSGNLIANSGTIPLIKQFALGGIGSVRGYQDQELNFGTALNVFSASFVNYRTELDVPFAGSLKLAGFLDAAQIYLSTFSLTSNLLYGAGFGLRYQTPVGPVNLDWGFKLNPLPNTGTQAFYFSIGVI